MNIFPGLPFTNSRSLRNAGVGKTASSSYDKEVSEHHTDIMMMTNWQREMKVEEKEGWWEGWWEGGKEERREGGMVGGKEGGKEERREGKREGGKEGIEKEDERREKESEEGKEYEKEEGENSIKPVLTTGSVIMVDFKSSMEVSCDISRDPIGDMLPGTGG